MISFRRLLVLALILCQSCSYHGDKIQIDVARALKSKVCLLDLCADIETNEIMIPDNVDWTIPSNPRISVSKGNVCLLDSSGTRIVVFDINGKFLQIVNVGEHVVDFYAYKGRLIDILTCNGIKEAYFDRADPIDLVSFTDKPIKYKSIARRDDNSIYLVGVNGNQVNDTHYVLSDFRRHSAVNPVCWAGEILENRFFECRDSLYYYYAKSGMILYYTDDDFIWPVYEWKFKYKKNDCLEVVFNNVQKNGSALFIDFYCGRDSYFLVYDTQTGKNTIVKQSEGIRFPLGVITEGVNYYCCTSGGLKDCFSGWIKHNDIQRIIDPAIDENAVILVKIFEPRMPD